MALYRAIQLSGGAYLTYLGVTLWRGAGTETQATAATAASRSAAYMRGALTNLSNPKSVVYFGSIFALFLRPGTPSWVQVTAIAIVLANTIVWYGAVALLFSSPVVRRHYARAQRPVNRIAGTVMIAFGARLMFAASEP